MQVKISFEKYTGLGVVAFKAVKETGKSVTHDFTKPMVAEDPVEYGKKD